MPKGKRLWVGIISIAAACALAGTYFLGRFHQAKADSKQIAAYQESWYDEVRTNRRATNLLEDAAAILIRENKSKQTLRDLLKEREEKLAIRREACSWLVGELNKERELRAGIAGRCQQAIEELRESELKRHGAIYLSLEEEFGRVPRERVYKLVDAINSIEDCIRILPLRDLHKLKGYYFIPTASNVSADEYVQAFKKTLKALQDLKD